MEKQKNDSRRVRRVRSHRPPFWQADKPYLHEHHISDVRFRVLGYVMALLAGAINAGGFFAVARYTSHVTGEMSYAADMAYLGEWKAVSVAMLGVVSFILGAAHSSWVILWTKRQRFRGSFGLSMWLEAVYLLLFGLIGVTALKWGGNEMPSVAMLLLCFIMGMHNTVMTILSGGAIRSTHMTGTATDLGIEISKMLYYRRSDNPKLPHVHVNKPKAKLFAGLMIAFLLGGVVGAWGYHTVGHHFALPVAAVLFVLGFGSVGYDVRLRIKFMLVRRLNLRGRGNKQ
ncbi:MULTISPECIES: YoaK family protein [unclassified Neisseria]|uniref:YoaK family protein n=1 Tax=unclassified Neisseria TaxID=2623750 RepID=UPI0026654743|nr:MULTISPECIES: YoaK family protein [unclassified Neisseria]MDO1510762.1 YoaK family protein [Neisseria sp. MVDL19-042950]MDO1517051.1 YoaK family protein [Neisseria sp. MVDL18-041461]MDO1564414.1 YoaK family protein [Neisseria sp. MVDL20-010259]